MGSGKSSAAITYMNEHPEKKFVYITPYLDEVSRICRGVTTSHFYQPVHKDEYNGSKIAHTFDLIRQGKNVSTTHQAFRMYPGDLLETIRSQHYTLIADECVNVLQEIDTDRRIVELAVEAGYYKDTGNDSLELVKSVGYERLNKLEYAMKNGGVVYLKKKIGGVYTWLLTADLINAFDDAYVMTYMFNGQDMHCMFKMNGIEYKEIGVRKDNGTYRFAYEPPYNNDGSHIPGLIHILDNKRLNAVGEKRNAISAGWLERNDDLCKELKDNMVNFFRNIQKSKSSRNMWSTYGAAQQKLAGGGYTKGFVPFNCRAKNDYRDKDCLAYCVNVFMNVGQKLFFQSRGIEIDDDQYALSVMVQWIWRSAIRDGKEIWLYLPSRRMRDLLTAWLQTLTAEGGVTDDGDKSMCDVPA